MLNETSGRMLGIEGIDEFIAENPGYIETIISKIPRLDKIENDPEWDTAEFRIALAKISLKKEEDGRILVDVFIPDEPFVAFSKENRRLFERYPDEEEKTHPAEKELIDFISNQQTISISPFLARFSAGGNLTIIKAPKYESYLSLGSDLSRYAEEDFEEYVIIVQRDNGTDQNPNHLTLASGIAEREEDWINPRLVIATECVEEIRVSAKAEDIRFQPNFSSIDSDTLNFRADDIAGRREDWIYKYEEIWSSEIKDRPGHLLFTMEGEPCEAEIIDIGNDVLSITYKGDSETYEGKIVLDAPLAAIDLMAAVRFTIPRPMRMLRISDGEGITVTYDGKKTPKLLWRNIYAFRPNEFRKLFEGEISTADYFFGRNIDDQGNYINQWYDGVPVRLDAMPQMTSPLRGAGLALLKAEYGLAPDFEMYDRSQASITKLDFAIK